MTKKKVIVPVHLDLPVLLSERQSDADEKNRTLFLLKTLLTAENVKKYQMEKTSKPSKKRPSKVVTVYQKIEVFYDKEGKLERYKNDRQPDRFQPDVKNPVLKQKGLGKTRIAFKLALVAESIKTEYCQRFLGHDWPEYIVLANYSLVYIPTIPDTTKHYAIVDPKCIGEGAQAKVQNVLGIVIVNPDNSITIDKDSAYVLKTGEVLIGDAKAEKHMHYLLRELHFVQEIDFPTSSVQWLGQVNKRLTFTPRLFSVPIPGRYVEKKDELANRSTYKVRHIEKRYSGFPLSEILQDYDTCAIYPLPTKIQILKRIARQLSWAFHQHEKVHHDIKTENILITEDIAVSIIDRGTCRYAGEKSSYCDSTPLYAPPELISNLSDNTANIARTATDVYSLGVLATEMFYNTLPPMFQYHNLYFTGLYTQKDKDLFIDIAPPVTLQTADDCVQHFLSKLLAQDVEKRLQNAAEVLDAISELEANLSKLTTTSSTEANPTMTASASMATALPSNSLFQTQAPESPASSSSSDASVPSYTGN
jgi:serine/threonine protein kinase